MIGFTPTVMPARKPRIRVALADDHTMFRKGIVELLRANADVFEIVAEAANGKELIDFFHQLTSPPHVCLLDVNMPIMDGYKTLALLKKEYPAVKFLTLSMYDHEMAVIRMLRLGASGYLLKEDDPDELKYAIEYVMKHDFYSSEITRAHLKGLRKDGDEYKKVELTANEQRFLELACTEMIYKEIAREMVLSVRTIEGYRDDLFGRLGVGTRTGLVIYALKTGMVSL